jgi:hypothetical protein
VVDTGEGSKRLSAAEKDREAAEDDIYQQRHKERWEEVSADKLRKAGAPVFRRQGPKLRLVSSSDERPRPTIDPELKAIIEDMNRRLRARCERIERDPGGKDAA